MTNSLPANQYAPLEAPLLPKALEALAAQVTQARGVYAEAKAAQAEADREAHGADESYRQRIVEAARLGKPASSVTDDRAMKRDAADAALIAVEGTKRHLDDVWRQYLEALRAEVPAVRAALDADCDQAQADAVEAVDEAVSRLRALLPLIAARGYVETVESGRHTVNGVPPVYSSRAEVRFRNSAGRADSVTFDHLVALMTAAARQVEVVRAGEDRRRARVEADVAAEAATAATGAESGAFAVRHVVVGSSADVDVLETSA